MYNFDDLNETNYGFPELKYIREAGKNQQQEGINEEKILSEALEFAVSFAKTYFDKNIEIYINQANKALRELFMCDKWVTLGHIAEEAQLKATSILRKDKALQDIAELYYIQLLVLRMSIPDIKKAFKKEWLMENAPELLKEK